MTHWTDFLTEEESKRADDLALKILQNKDELKALRKAERQLLETGTSRRRRAKK
jgi:hypothetical protein